MCNIVLNDNLSIRLYFEKVLELVKSGEDFPVNLDDVWPLIYSDKGKAVRVLTILSKAPLFKEGIVSYFIYSFDFQCIL